MTKYTVLIGLLIVQVFTAGICEAAGIDVTGAPVAVDLTEEPLPEELPWYLQPLPGTGDGYELAEWPAPVRAVEFIILMSTFNVDPEVVPEWMSAIFLVMSLTSVFLFISLIRGTE